MIEAYSFTGLMCRPNEQMMLSFSPHNSLKFCHQANKHLNPSLPCRFQYFFHDNNYNNNNNHNDNNNEDNNNNINQFIAVPFPNLKNFNAVWSSFCVFLSIDFDIWDSEDESAAKKGNRQVEYGQWDCFKWRCDAQYN